MGLIKIPKDAKIILHDKVGKDWVNETQWKGGIKKQFGFGQAKTAKVITLPTGVKVPFDQYFYSLEKKPFIAFFNTHFGPDPPGWNSIMSVSGYRITDPSIGNYAIIKAIERHGHPIQSVRDLDDILFELKGDDVLLLVDAKRIPTAFLGDIDDYPDLLEVVKFSFLEG